MDRAFAASEIAGAISDLSFYCLDGSGSGTDAVDRLVRVARQYPGLEYDGRTMSQVLADEASDLEGCDAGLARELDRARETLR